MAASPVFEHIVNDTSSAVAAIVNGHTHQAYAYQAPVPGQPGVNRPIIQTGQYAANVGQITLTVDRDTDTVTASAVKNVPRTTTSVADLIAAYPTVLGPINDDGDGGVGQRPGRRQPAGGQADRGRHHRLHRRHRRRACRPGGPDLGTTGRPSPRWAIWWPTPCATRWQARTGGRPTSAWSTPGVCGPTSATRPTPRIRPTVPAPSCIPKPTGCCRS